MRVKVRFIFFCYIILLNAPGLAIAHLGFSSCPRAHFVRPGLTRVGLAALLEEVLLLITVASGDAQGLAQGGFLFGGHGAHGVQDALRAE